MEPFPLGSGGADTPKVEQGGVFPPRVGRNRLNALILRVDLDTPTFIPTSGLSVCLTLPLLLFIMTYLCLSYELSYA